MRYYFLKGIIPLAAIIGVLIAFQNCIDRIVCISMLILVVGGDLVRFFFFIINGRKSNDTPKPRDNVTALK